MPSGFRRWNCSKSFRELSHDVFALHERMQGLLTDAQLLIMKSRIVQARFAARRAKRVQRSGGRLTMGKRDELIVHLEAALALADEVGDSVTGYLIETALDQARVGEVAFGAALRPEAEVENEQRRQKTRAGAFRRRRLGENGDT